MLVDLARERWAARRDVSAEIWRCVAPFADDDGKEALVQALHEAQGDDLLVVVAALTPAPEELRDAVIRQSGKQVEIGKLQAKLDAITSDGAKFA